MARAIYNPSHHFLPFNLGCSAEIMVLGDFARGTRILLQKRLPFHAPVFLVLFILTYLTYYRVECAPSWQVGGPLGKKNLSSFSNYNLLFPVFSSSASDGRVSTDISFRLHVKYTSLRKSSWIYSVTQCN